MININDYFDNYPRKTGDLTLSVMNFFIKEQYNDFQKNMKFIHVAGTNGKGSTVETISNILIAEGYCVGTFISPHLEKYNERIKINNNPISDTEFSNLIEEVTPKINLYDAEHENKVSFFEIITIIALIYFYRKKVDFVVLEVGCRWTF